MKIGIVASPAGYYTADYSHDDLFRWQLSKVSVRLRDQLPLRGSAHQLTRSGLYHGLIGSRAASCVDTIIAGLDKLEPQ